MATKTINIQITVSVLDGKIFPLEQEIIDKVVDHLYDYTIGDAAIIDTVHITHIDGKPTNELG